MVVTYQKIAIVAGVISLGSGCIAANPAQATSLDWGISFFDNAGTTVGTGTFSYDPDITTFVQTSPDLPDSTLPAQGFNVNTALESFAATILGQPWHLPSAGITWLDASEGLRQQRFYRSPLPFIADYWFFGDLYRGTRQLTLDGQKSPADQWSGSWSQSIVEVGSSNDVSGSGSWIAALQPQAEGVPEPTTVLGSVVFGLGCLLRKKLTVGKKA